MCVCVCLCVCTRLYVADVQCVGAGEGRCEARLEVAWGMWPGRGHDEVSDEVCEQVP